MYDYQQRMSRPTGPDYIDTSGAQGFFEDGWLMFSGLMIFFVGFWNAFEGGLAFLRSAYFAGRNAPVVTVVGVQALSRPGLLISVEATALSNIVR